MKNYQAILMAVVGIGLAILTGKGIIQNYIGFAGDLNEMAFACVGGMLGLMGLAAIDYRKLIKGLL